MKAVRTGVWRATPPELARFQCLLEIHPFVVAAPPPSQFALRPSLSLSSFLRKPRRACHARCIVVLSTAISLSVSRRHRNPSRARVNLSTHVTHTHITHLTHHAFKNAFPSVSIPCENLPCRMQRSPAVDDAVHHGALALVFIFCLMHQRLSHAITCNVCLLAFFLVEL